MFLEFFEGTLSSDLREGFDKHVAACARCQGLIRDIDGIREQASALPELAPSRDLWSGIEARIQPRVVSIAPHPAGQLSRRWLAAAAAALIVATSGITYVATTHSFNASTAGSVARSSATLPPQVAVATPPDASVAAGPDASSGAAPSVSPTVASSSGPKTSRASGQPGRSVNPPAAMSRTSLASASAAPATASDLAFASEINQLQSVLIERRSQLDPQTVKVVEDNLRLIDTAVKRARSALAKDPASGFLTRQLDNALQKKVELLRTVALLPAST